MNKDKQKCICCKHNTFKSKIFRYNKKNVCGTCYNINKNKIKKEISYLHESIEIVSTPLVQIIESGWYDPIVHRSQKEEISEKVKRIKIDLNILYDKLQKEICA